MKVGVTNMMFAIMTFLAFFFIFCNAFPPLQEYYDQMQNTTVGPGHGFGGGGAGARTAETTSEIGEFTSSLEEETGGLSWLGPLAQVFWVAQKISEWVDGINRQIQIVMLAVSIVDTHLKFPLLSSILSLMMGFIVFCVIRMIAFGGS